MDETLAVPKVSIGMPVFNGEQFIRGALDSLLGQSFSDFELIISDNASTDGTERICREYVARDQRVSYVRQPNNIGAAANFKFVLDEARGEYFMWAACDDIRSPDFIELNFKFLSENPEYVASTSPNGFEGRSMDNQSLESFALDGEIFERFIRFFNYCWVSHGIFYSLVRTNVLRSCEFIGQSFTAADWAIILYLAKQGRLNRSKEGWTTFGTKGTSSGPNALNAFRNSPIERVLPLFKITKITLDLIKHFPARHSGPILFALGKVNFRAAKIQLILLLRKYFGSVVSG